MARAMKDSGVVWIGEIPRDWGVYTLKSVASVNDNVLSEDVAADLIIEYVDIGSVSADKGIEFTQTIVFGDAPSRARRLVKHGDVIVSTVRTYLRAIAPIIQPPSNLVVSTGFAVIRPRKKVVSEFIAYSLQDDIFMSEVTARSTGVSYPAINANELMSIQTVVPPKTEQRAIADYLDRQTELIDQRLSTLAEKKAVLAELRKAIIHMAVTKGLNKSVPMKDSGVDWIGEIPQGWPVRRGKDIFAKRSLPAFDTDEIVTCFRDGQVTLRKNRREEGFTIAIKEHGYQGVRVGDLVVHAMDAFAGAIGISESNGKCSPVYSICRARQPSKTDLRFYSYVLRDMALNGYIQSVGQGIRERSTDFRFREVEVAFYCQPSFDEQRAIADNLDRQTALIDAQVATLDEQAQALRELRKSIIHEAVTGKIDLSHYTPPPRAGLAA